MDGLTIGFIVMIGIVISVVVYFVLLGQREAESMINVTQRFLESPHLPRELTQYEKDILLDQGMNAKDVNHCTIQYSVDYGQWFTIALVYCRNKLYIGVSKRHQKDAPDSARGRKLALERVMERPRLTYKETA